MPSHMSASDPVSAEEPVAMVKSIRRPSGTGVVKRPTSPATTAELAAR